MRIDPNVAVSPITLDQSKTHTPTKAAQGQEGSSVVSLSSAASSVSPSDGPSPSVNERIEKIRALLEKSEYPVDLDLLAARIVDDDAARIGWRS